MPFDTLVPTGTSSTIKRYILPVVPNTIRVSTVLVEIVVKIALSSVLTPLPFLFCVLKDFLGIRLIFPAFVTTTTTSSGTTISISFSSFGKVICANSVLRASPNFLTISSSLDLSSLF